MAPASATDYQCHVPGIPLRAHVFSLVTPTTSQAAGPLTPRPNAQHSNRHSSRPVTALVLAYSTTQQALAPAATMQAALRANYAAQARCAARRRAVHAVPVYQD